MSQGKYIQSVCPMVNVNKIIYLPSVMFCPWFVGHINSIVSRISTKIISNPENKSIVE